MTAFRIDDPVRVLERLLVVCADGAAGYRRAAAAVSEPRIHRRLVTSATQREAIGSVLTDALVELGRSADGPDEERAPSGGVHRRWRDAVARVASEGALAILRECERGERETLEAFSTALGRSLPIEIHSAVQSQLGRVLEASAALRGEIRVLEDDLVSSGGCAS